MLVRSLYKLRHENVFSSPGQLMEDIIGNKNVDDK